MKKEGRSTKQFISAFSYDLSNLKKSTQFYRLQKTHGDLGRIKSVLGRWYYGDGGFQSFQVPATLDRNNSVTVAPVHFLFCYNKPEVESFRSRVRLSKSSKNWPRNENFRVNVSEVGWLSLKWYGVENVYNWDRQRPDSLANTDRRRSLNRKKAK